MQENLLRKGWLKLGMENKNHDMESILKKALSSSEKPDAELVKKVKYGLVEEKAASLKKSAIKYYLNRVAAVAIVMVIITTTALVASGNLGGFDRLRTIIGEERIGLVSPIEISNVVGETITEDGIRVELVAVGVFDNVVDIYLTFEDMVGNRLDGDFIVAYSIDLPADDIRGTIRHSGIEVIDRTDGVITVHDRLVFSQPVAGQELFFRLWRIDYNNITYNEHEINFDLAELMFDAPSSTQLIFGSHEIRYMWGIDADDARELLTTTGVTILEPNLHDIELGLEGIESLISAIGIIDGRLHIQLYDPPLNNNRRFSLIALINPEGELDANGNLNIGFSIDEFGNFYTSYKELPHYRESIFEVDLDRLSEYRLVGSFANTEYIDLELAVTFEFESDETQLIVLDGLNIEYGTSVIREIRLNPFAFLVIGEVAEYGFVEPIRYIRINTDNGAATTTFNMVSRWGRDERGVWIGNWATWVYNTNRGFQGWSYMSDEALLDLDSVISIEIAGEIIELR